MINSSSYDEWIECLCRKGTLSGTDRTDKGKDQRDGREDMGVHEIILCENLEEAVKVCAEKAQPGRCSSSFTCLRKLGTV